MEQNQMNNYSFLSKIKSHVNSSVVLIVCTILALLCANMPWTSSWYNSLWQNEVSLSIGRFNLFSHGGHPMTLMQVINDFLMAIFFLSVGLEIKREILVGELSSLKKALLPIIGACGGMIVPVVIYALLAHGNPIAHRGLAIPMATDIAFSLGVLAIFKTRVPVGLKVFLAALAVADDLGGIIVIALFYTSGINWIFFTLAVICILAMVIANWRKVRSKAFYLIVGLVLWYMMLNSGIHATIAGVIVAFCVPSTLKNGTGHYLERIRNNISKFPVIDIDNQHNTVVLTHDQIHILKSIESAADKLISPLQDLEDNLQGLINWFVIPLFAFANAGVVLKGMAPGELFSGVSLAVMLGLIVGKFVGVFSFSWISVKLKLVSLPQGADWKSFASVCVLCGIGFTVSMFIADLSFSPLGQDGVQYLNQAKFGILSGSLIAALLGAFLLGRNLPKEDNQN